MSVSPGSSVTSEVGLKTMCPAAFLMATMITPRSWRTRLSCDRDAGQRALRGDARLLDLQFEVLGPRRQLDEVDDRRPEHRLGHAGAADDVGRDHAVGPGPQQLLLRPRSSARATMNSFSFSSRALIVMYRLSASEAMTDTRARARSMPARCSTSSEVASPCSGMPCGMWNSPAARRLLDDDERQALRGELAADEPAHAAVAADDEVVLHLRQAAFHALPPQHGPDLAADDGAEHLRECRRA